MGIGVGAMKVFVVYIWFAIGKECIDSVWSTKDDAKIRRDEINQERGRSPDGWPAKIKKFEL